MLGRTKRSRCFRTPESCMFYLPPAHLPGLSPAASVMMLPACNGACTTNCLFLESHSHQPYPAPFIHRRKPKRAALSPPGVTKASPLSASVQAAPSTLPSGSSKGLWRPWAGCLGAGRALGGHRPLCGALMLPGTPLLPSPSAPFPPQPLRCSRCRRSLSFIWIKPSSKPFGWVSY